MKVAVHLLAVVVLAGLLGVPGARLYFEGSRQFAEYKAHFPELSAGPDFGIFKDPEASGLTFDPYMFYDPPTGTMFYLSVPTIPFGQFLIIVAVALIGLDVCWLTLRRNASRETATASAV